jgi:hypothetical protein
MVLKFYFASAGKDGSWETGLTKVKEHLELKTSRLRCP